MHQDDSGGSPDDRRAKNFARMHEDGVKGARGNEAVP